MERLVHPGTVVRSPEPHAAATRREARAGMAMSLATLSMAAASGLQAVLYLSRFGVTGRTDGFFVAFAVYTTFGVFSQSLRLTSVPLLVEPGARLTVREFGAVLTVVSVPLLIATCVVPDRLADVIAPGLEPAFRSVTQQALPILGVATVLQLWAAGGATVLAVRDRFAVIARSYMAGAGAGLAAYLVLVHRTGELSLGWSMLVMAIVTAVMMLAGVWQSVERGARRVAGARSVRSLLAKTGFVLGRTAVYLALNLLFVITLAFASRSARGDTTVLSYAYLFASYLVAGTGMAVGMSRIPDMTRAARAAGATIVADTVTKSFRYAMLFVAPAFAVLVSAGAPLVHEVLPGSLDRQGVHTLRVFVALLALWTVAALAVNVLLPALFALGRPVLVNLLALPLLVVHIIATAVGYELFGVDGVVGAMAIAPSLLVAVLLVTACRQDSGTAARELVVDALRFSALAACAFGAGAILGVTVGDGFVATVVAGVSGAALYVLGARIAAPRQLTVVLTALRPARS